MTEKPILNTVESSLVNMTSEVQIRYTGPRLQPERNEAGRKDPVRANGRPVTRIIVRFEGYPGR
ncbi:MAG: hypothetical protein WBX22_33295 [Silvibacterium sp.]